MNLFQNIGTTELIIIGIVLVLLFGGKKIKELARGLGEGTKELRNVKKEITDPEIKSEKKGKEVSS